ncbi:hypothetical protein P3X46_010043 [Hevea brasiliensis]|uniref:RRM domain-containing protein n=1 Tax=Hevea brasiliensis TaxID=3981 RepID=A0ABQ9MGV8_HEVBR|nr:hypothetical protein P3X46_010043 [Hevea brasiliensis]
MEEKVDPSLNPYCKTSLCSYFRRRLGSCCHGIKCRYAHGEEELRPRPDNTWDPTSERAKKAMKLEDNGDKCEERKAEEVMMTEWLVDVGEGGEGECLDPGLSKCLVHLPRKWTSDNLRSFLNEQGVFFKMAKKKKGMVVGFVTFDTADQLKIASEELERRTIGNKKMKVADVVLRSHDKKIKSAMAGDIDNSSSKAKSARDIVTPLAHMPYEEQNARKACPNGISLPEWVLKSREIGGLACKLEGILESPLVNGYCNKCKFSVGYSLEGKPIVGFMLGNFRDGVTAVEEPVDCPNVSSIACVYASIFQEFLQQSGLLIWNRFKNTGFWRQLTVCSTGFEDEEMNGELAKLAVEFAFEAEANYLPFTVLVPQDYQGISSVAPADAPLRVFFCLRRESSSEVETAKNMVEGRIHDHISNLRFSISPTAFFQVNTLAAEKLYSLAGDWAGLGPDTLLLDNAEINGIKNCRFVCGKAENVMASLLKEYLNGPQRQDEPNSCESNNNDLTTDKNKGTLVDNVLDDNDNSSHKLDDCKGASGCPENGGQEHQSKLQKSCSSEDGSSSIPQFKNIVAIVDPPCSGLYPILIKVLRTHSHLRRLVYISSNPETLVANAIELCTPSPEKIEKGNMNNWAWRNMSSAGLARHKAKSMPISEPFQPVKAMAVDLFPHTAQCEMVMLLER